VWCANSAAAVRCSLKFAFWTTKAFILGWRLKVWEQGEALNTASKQRTACLESSSVIKEALLFSYVTFLIFCLLWCKVFTVSLGERQAGSSPFACHLSLMRKAFVTACVFLSPELQEQKRPCFIIDARSVCHCLRVYFSSPFACLYHWCGKRSSLSACFLSFS